MTTAEMIKVMQAYAEGKQIQIKDVWGKWVDIDGEPLWCWGQSDYRIKPEAPKYRPYKDTAEMVADFKERFGVDVPSYAMPLIWIIENNGDKSLITAYDKYGVCGYTRAFEWDELMHHCTYLDGSPVGKLVEE